MAKKDYESLESEKAWVLVVPTYAWQIPKVVKKWLIKTELKGNRDIYFVMTCESQIGDAAGYAKAIADYKNLEFKGVEKVIMPNNYFIMTKTVSAMAWITEV